MDLPEFPTDALDLPNDELGALLLGYFIAAQAYDLGIPPDQIPEEFAEQVRQRVLTLETALAGNAALEKALHKAAGGDFETAGRLFREHMLSGATALKFIPIGIKKSAQAKSFGNTGTKKKKEQGAETEKTVLDAAKEILASRDTPPSSDRQFAQLIEPITGIPANTVRTHLRRLRSKKLVD